MRHLLSIQLNLYNLKLIRCTRSSRDRRRTKACHRPVKIVTSYGHVTIVYGNVCHCTVHTHTPSAVCSLHQTKDEAKEN